MDWMTNLLNLYELTCFDNESDDTGDAGANADAAAAAAAGAPAAAAGEKSFNQAQLNEVVGKEKKKLNEKYATLEANYTELLEQQGLSDSHRQKLQTDLENIQAQMRTKEQQIEFEKKQARTKFESELKASVDERDYYRNLFETTTSQREITDAAMELEGFNGQDFIAHLGPRSRVADEVDAEGKKTGRKVTQITWDITDPESGKTTQVEKRPKEVIKMMKEDPDGRWGNLFKSNVARGVGSGSAPGQAQGAGAINHAKLTDEEYFRMREDPAFRERAGLGNRSQY
jgi:hypothetical protein